MDDSTVTPTVTAVSDGRAPLDANGRDHGSAKPVCSCGATTYHAKHPDRCANGHLTEGNTARGVSAKRFLADRETQVNDGRDRYLRAYGFADPARAAEPARMIATKCAQLDLLGEKALAGNRISTYTQLLDRQQSLLKSLDGMRPSPSAADPALRSMTMEELLAESAAVHERIATAMGVEARLRPVIDAWLRAGPATPEAATPGGPPSPDGLAGAPPSDFPEGGRHLAITPDPAAPTGRPTDPPPPVHFADLLAKPVHSAEPTTPEALYPNVTEADVRETLRNEGDEVLDAYDRGRLLKFEAYSRADARLKQIRQITGSRPPKTPA